MLPTNQLKKIKFNNIRLTNKASKHHQQLYTLIFRILRKISENFLDRTRIVNFLKKLALEDSFEKYSFIFFKMPEELYHGIKDDPILEIKVNSKSAIITLNEYMTEEQYCLRNGLNFVKVPKNSFEVGENILAYKGKCKIRNLIYEEKKENKRLFSRNYPVFKYYKNSTEIAAEFLCKSIINEPQTSPFRDSCYTIYDYDNSCYRMPCWLWSDSPTVSALLELANVTSDKKRRAYYENTAVKIGNVLFNHQIMDTEHKHFGALISRYRYYKNTRKAFDCLLGPNDTSFIIKWAFLPLYRHTKEERFKQRSELALDWTQRSVFEFSFVPSQYYLYENRWEEGAFVDTGFTPEGFVEYDEEFITDKSGKYTETADFFMERFIKQFKLKSGFYGRYYFSPGGKVKTTLITRGQGWVLEGLLSSYKGTNKIYYKKEAMKLAKLLVGQQNTDGSWAFLLGNNYPSGIIKRESGICEKTTALLAYLMLNLYTICEEKSFLQSGKLALEWCEQNIFLEKTQGYGGIVSSSLGSGITGPPYIKVATGYANAFYIMGSLLYNKLT